MTEVAAIVDRLLREEGSRVIAGLYRSCRSLALAEDAFQEALAVALARWPQTGVPENPAGWVTTVAKNHLLQARRHEGVAAEKAALLKEDEAVEAANVEAVTDDQLRLIFTCCHPALAQEAQVALSLKILAGFSVGELARAFVVPEATMAQRLVRAKRQVDDEGLALAVPGRRELSERLPAVLAVVYLVLNEGHTGSQGELLRAELLRESLRLARLLTELLPTEAEVFGLAALVAFTAARAATRTDESGRPMLLAEQDRTRWDGALILEGLVALQRAQRLGGSSYTLQAELASWHCTAARWEDTPWRRVLGTYDRLLALSPSPVVALNRAVALAMLDGPDAGLVALAPLEGALSRYHLFYATRADLLRRAGRSDRADLERALELATNDAERALLRERMKS